MSNEKQTGVMTPDELEYLQTHEMSRRDFLLDSLAVGGLAASFGLAPSMSAWAGIQPPDDEVVRIGYLPITDATVLLVAHAKGFFEEEGLKAERPTLIRGWSPLVEGFAAGKFNLVHFLKPIPIWMRYNNGFPVKIMSWAHLNGSGVVVGKHVKANNFSDLGGLQVAVPYWYSMHNIVLQMGLKHAGLKPVIKSQGEPIAPDEVNLKIMPPPDMPHTRGQEDRRVYRGGTIQRGGRTTRRGQDAAFHGRCWRNHPCCVVCMNELQVTKNPEWSQKVMNAIVKAQVYSRKTSRKLRDCCRRMGEVSAHEAKVVERAMTLFSRRLWRVERHTNASWGSGRIDFQPWPFPSATKLIVDELKNTLVGGDNTFLNDLDPDFVVDDLVDYQFVKKAMEKHSGWEKVPGFNAANPFDREEIVSI